MALPPSLHQHCTNEAQKAETVLSAVSYIYTYIYTFFCFKLALRQNVQIRLFFEKPNFLTLLPEAWDLYLAGLKRIL